MPMKLEAASGGCHQPWLDGRWFEPHYYTTEQEARDHAARHEGAEVTQTSPAGLTRRRRGEPKDEGIWRADIPITRMATVTVRVDGAAAPVTREVWPAARAAGRAQQLRDECRRAGTTHKIEVET